MIKPLKPRKFLELYRYFQKKYLEEKQDDDIRAFILFEPIRYPTLD